MNRNYKINRQKPAGFVALIVVIMVTAIILVSSVTIGIINSSSSVSSYQLAESDEVAFNLESCLDDALWQIASSTDTYGSFSIDAGGVLCAYQISATSAGLKTVTSTATTTSSLGNWNRTVIMQVNVSSTPTTIESYHDYTTPLSAAL